MADHIRQAVAIQREMFEGVGQRDELHALIARFVNANLYKRTAGQAEKLRKRIVRLVATKWLPDARQVGQKSALPILQALRQAKLTEKGSKLRGRALRSMKRYSKANARAFESALRGEVGQLTNAVETAFMRATRDQVARKTLIRDLLGADRDELKRLKQVYGEIDDTAEQLAAAERRLARASKGTRRKAKAAHRKAKTAHLKAKRKVRTAKSFLARFETRCLGHARDSIRREGQRAQQAHFENAGYLTFSWVSVNGTDACPDCESRHGRTQSRREWQSDGMPGDGSTVCGASCMCQLVPEEYTKGNESLLKPIMASA